MDFDFMLSQRQYISNQIRIYKNHRQRMSQLQIEPPRYGTPSSKKGQDNVDKSQNPIEGGRQEQGLEHLSERNLTKNEMIQILRQINHKNPQSKDQTIENENCKQHTGHYSWCEISCFLLISILLGSAISIAAVYGMIRYRVIAFNSIENTVGTEVLRSVGNDAPANSQQSINSNQFCGTINLNIQNGTNIQNERPIVNYPQPDGDWVYFENQKHIFTFSFNNVNENVFNFTDVIPKEKKVKYIKMLIYNQAGYSGNKVQFQYWIRTRVLNGNKEWVHTSAGYRYWQDAVTFNSQEVIVPCSETRQIRFKTTHIQLNGALSYFITGYLPDNS